MTTVVGDLLHYSDCGSVLVLLDIQCLNHGDIDISGLLIIFICICTVHLCALVKKNPACLTCMLCYSSVLKVTSQFSRSSLPEKKCPLHPIIRWMFSSQFLQLGQPRFELLSHCHETMLELEPFRDNLVQTVLNWLFLSTHEFNCVLGQEKRVRACYQVLFKLHWLSHNPYT